MKYALYGLLLAFAAAGAVAQNPGTDTLPFSAQVQTIEKKLSSNAGPAEKNLAFRELARLMELSGNFESAARAWNEAAIALPERDYHALLRCAACLAASGEFENAAAAARAVLSGRDNTLRISALYLNGQIEAFRSGDTGFLRSLLADPAYLPYKAGIYYTIWKISGDAVYRTRLLSEFPQSPEALAVRDVIGAAPTALWLLGGLPPSDIQAAGPRGQDSDAQVLPGTTETQNPEGGPVMLQTGLFSLEANARSLAGRLSSAGFSPVITQKTINGSPFWTVGVPPGQDYNRTILLLKDAGFEAFPLY